MKDFRQQVEEIEDMTKSFIERSFQKLRSAEGAFELVQNFRNIQSRESINQSIDERYKDILSQYTKELDQISAIFHEYESSPPSYKNFPPVAGAIAWARDLYIRAKTPILRFKVRASWRHMWSATTSPGMVQIPSHFGLTGTPETVFTWTTTWMCMLRSCTPCLLANILSGSGRCRMYHHPLEHPLP